MQPRLRRCSIDPRHSGRPRHRLILTTISTICRSEGRQMQSTSRKIDHHESAKLLEILRERAEARAQLVANGLHSLQDSVDTLQAAAETQGLVARYGQDRIQEILAEAFGRWRLE
jgi:hypothetical protein